MGENAEGGRFKEDAKLYVARPSACMKALFTAALACGSVHVYGFFHAGMAEENYKKEHDFLDRLVQGKVQETDFPDMRATKFSEEAARFRARLMCMSRGRKISMTRRH